MSDDRKTTALVSSVGADEEQSFIKNPVHSIADDSAEINDYEKSRRSFASTRKEILHYG